MSAAEKSNNPLMVVFKFIVAVAVIVTAASINNLFTIFKDAYDSSIAIRSEFAVLEKKFEQHEKNTDREIDRLWRKLLKSHPGAHND